MTLLCIYSRYLMEVLYRIYNIYLSWRWDL